MSIPECHRVGSGHQDRHRTTVDDQRAVVDVEKEWRRFVLAQDETAVSSSA
ncbi:hypothetical protein [Glaciibacter flavus]|uniref:hypothetical protein n=1 Tax=Orlajensenia flava TaxID=2565934 RepID=UPI003AFFFFAE